MNKNTKRRQNEIRKAAKGGTESCSETKNCKMVVRTNVGEDGKKFSITRFEPINEFRPVYRRFGDGRAS